MCNELNSSPKLNPYLVPQSLASENDLGRGKMCCLFTALAVETSPLYSSLSCIYTLSLNRASLFDFFQIEQNNNQNMHKSRRNKAYGSEPKLKKQRDIPQSALPTACTELPQQGSSTVSQPEPISKDPDLLPWQRHNPQPPTYEIELLRRVGTTTLFLLISSLVHHECQHSLEVRNQK